MFKITKDGATVAMTEAPNYIKQAENGCFVLCPEAEATGIAHNGTVYHLLGRPDMAGAEITVMLEETDAGAEIRLNLEGLAGLARDMAAKQPRERMAA